METKEIPDKVIAEVMLSEFVPQARLYGEFLVAEYTENRLIFRHGGRWAIPFLFYCGIAFLVLPFLFRGVGGFEVMIAVVGLVLIYVFLTRDSEIILDKEQGILEHHTALGRHRIAAENIKAVVMRFDSQNNNIYLVRLMFLWDTRRRTTYYKPMIMEFTDNQSSYRLVELACWCSIGYGVPLRIEGQPNTTANVVPELSSFLDSITKHSPEVNGTQKRDRECYE